MAKKKTSSRSMKQALEESKGMEMCACGESDCEQCGSGVCCEGSGCGNCCGYSCDEGNWKYLKYAKLLLGILLVVSALWPSVLSARWAIGLLGLWIVFKSALKIHYKY